MTELPDDAEILLSRLREWLREAHAPADSPESDRQVFRPHADADADGDEAQRDVGLYRLVEEFTALRHEVKLQTKGSRGLQEQAETLLQGLHLAIDHFRAVEPREEQAARAAARPLAEALIELDEALDRGRDELEKAGLRLLQEPVQAIQRAVEELDARQPWYRRLVQRHYQRQVHDILRQQADARLPLFEALLEGYDLICSRLRRALNAEQIRRTDCVGLPFDPELMSVVAVVESLDLPPGYVVDEVRRGYTWRGSVLRYAEVRAVSGAVTADELDDDVEDELDDELDHERNGDWFTD